MEFNLFGETGTSPGLTDPLSQPRRQARGSLWGLSKCLTPPYQSACHLPVRGRPFRAGWPGVLYKVYCPWNVIDAVPIRDCPEDEINRKNKLLNDAEMKHPIELVTPSR